MPLKHPRDCEGRKTHCEFLFNCISYNFICRRLEASLSEPPGRAERGNERNTAQKVSKVKVGLLEVAKPWGTVA
jgi:hypothetical protein